MRNPCWPLTVGALLTACATDHPAPDPRHVDATAPTFAGVATAAATSETALVLTWLPAQDDATPAAQIRYRVYLSVGAATDFSSPHAITAPGADTTIVGELSPATVYSVAVRAIDGAGNEDANTHSLSVVTPDHMGPVFAGVHSVSPGGAGELRVRWSAALDNATQAAQITYRVFAATASGAHDLGSPTLTTAAGATEVTLAGLAEATTYFVIVRAVDAVGNEENNTKELWATTIDATAPTFAGVTSAMALGTTITVSWSPASDASSPASELVYDVYWATSSGAQSFTTPSLTSAAGASGVLLTDLAVSTEYFFVVRARDPAGNRDDNDVEISATTADRSDVTPPSFAGATEATNVGPTSATIGWEPASDEVSAASDISYAVYVSETAGVFDLDAPTLIRTGVDAAELTALTPETTYYVLVRAIDLAGNMDVNTYELVIETLADTTPPEFAGLGGVTVLGPTSLRLDWVAATDDVSEPSQITYRVYVAAGAALDFSSPAATTAPGATSLVLTQLAPDTTHDLVVRAVDTYGNATSHATPTQATTDADTTAPSFAGGADATPTSETSGVVSWDFATDDTTQTSAILYHVCCAENAGECTADTFPPSASTTAPGATQATLSGLTPGTTYTCVVRAEDAFGNVDDNVMTVALITPADEAGPDFAGATSVSGASATSLTVNWEAAIDNVTMPPAIVYRICRTTIDGGCAGGSFSTTASVTGDTSYSFTAGLTPSTTYYFVVRAEDAAGNRDDNSVQVSGMTTDDVTAPIFAGATATSDASATTLTISWNAGSDDVTAPSGLVYDVCVSTSPTSCASSFGVSATTAAGATSYTHPGLAPSTTYHFVVRARDAAGNRDTNTVAVSGATLADTAAPGFAGASSVSGATVTTLTVGWVAADDDVTAPTAIVYDICVSTSPTACASSFTVSATSAAGATSYTSTNLDPGTAYHFVVRARDLAGNRDDNTVTQTGTTLLDTQAPAGGVVSGVTRTGCGAGTVTWGAATDNVTAAADLVYRVCWSTTSGACASSFVVRASVTGETSYSFSGLTAASTYYFVVRAEDTAGNRSINTTQLSVAMSDGVAPTWGAESTVTTVNCGAASSGSITLDWPNATDSCSGASGIRYRICRVGAVGNCTTTWSNDYTTSFNTSSYTINTGLAANTSYTFYIRAEDSYGNRETALNGPFTATTKLSFASAIASVWSAAPGNPGGCSGCHLFTHANTVNAASSCAGKWIISPNSTSDSSMYLRVNNLAGCGGVMPPAGNTTSSTFRANLTTWINQGACNN